MPSWTRLLLAVVVLGMATTKVVGEDEPLTEKIAALEDALSKQDKTIDGLKETVSALKADKTVVHSGSPLATMKISGRVHFDAWGFGDADSNIAAMNGGPDPQNRFNFRRLRFGVKGDILDNMFYKIEMEFAGGAGTQFRDAFLGWKELPLLQTVTLGNHKRPYGLDHLNSSRFNVFLERPFIIEGNNQDARRFGLSSSGVSENQACNWRYGVWNQQNVQATGSYINDSLQLELAGRFANTIWYDEVSGGRGYAHWAVSGTVADSEGSATSRNQTRFRTRPEARSSSSRWVDTGTVANAEYFTILGVESMINIGAMQFVGEYQTVSVERGLGSPDVDFNGGYVQASYFLTGEHMPWNRKSGTQGRIKPFQNFWMVQDCDKCIQRGWGAWQIAARLSYADYNDGTFIVGDPTAGIRGGYAESLTIGLNWYWNPNARMQFNYITGDIDGRSVSGAAPIDGDYSIYGARFMVDF